ncbi:hypothetical protein ACLOJK_017607 [Asimina triloba]
MKRNAHFLFSLTFLLVLPIRLKGASSAPRSILLACGSSSDGAADADGREWTGDSSSKFLVSPDNSESATAALQDPSLPSQIPYMTARIFTKESTYRFPVSSGKRYWLRLHFYPSSYNDRNATDSYFAVVADGVTLLRNFSAALTATALTQAYIINEYSLMPDSNNLEVVFTPSNKRNGSFAFINGIELIQMPDVFKSPATLVGMADRTIDVGDAPLQTMNRINVGGQYIPATNDSGLTRTWYDDTPYLSGAAIGAPNTRRFKIKIKYPDSVPRYIAPVDVYSTARIMAGDPKTNLNYNLTWVFQIDGNFMYIVRFHFCELNMDKVNERVFDIYVNNRTAEDGADVIAWAGSMGVPVYKDYAVYVNDGPGDDRLFVALHPSTEQEPEFYDVILNGLEIFKMSNTNGSLAGPNPVPSDMLVRAELIAGNPARPFKWLVVVAAIVGGMAALILAFALASGLIGLGRKPTENQSGIISGWLPLYSGSSQFSSRSRSVFSGKSYGSSHLSSMSIELCRHFTFAEIKRGTKNFDESLVIGVGGFGKVYKGVIDVDTKVAIKRANPSSEQGVHEFQTEIEMLSKLRHRHLVSLIGFCEENGEMILVYDYMSRGTLREHLYMTKEPPLSWHRRLEICIGAARGLHYLHTGARYTIIHRDVKTTNILIDEKWVAKVSDFGLSKTGPNVDQTHVSTVVKGSFGYLDPEYFRRQQLTEKSDVYSFGVVLFEVLFARPALNPSLSKEQVSLADWALHSQRKGTLENNIDPHLKGKIKAECLKKYVDIAQKCLADQGVDRPSMGDVLWNLEFALQLEDNPEGGGIPITDQKVTYSLATVPEDADLDSSNKSQTSADSEPNTSAVFSQYINPQGR